MSESTDNAKTKKPKSKSKAKAETKSKPKEKMKAETKSTPKEKMKAETKSKSKPKEKKIKKFSVSGTFLMGEVLQKFEKEVEARSEGRAKEKIFQDLGSKHGVKRSRVLIGTVEESK
jgi:ribosomal protein L20A (L18A)